jgi:D-aspartate ligase
MKSFKESKGIIVLGGHVQALGIIRILGRNGIPSVILDNTHKNLARHSKYCTESYVVEDNYILDYLTKMGETQNYKEWLVFPTNDFHVKLLSLNKKYLSKFFKITTDEWASVGLFYNKTDTYKLAKSLNIPIADTYFPESSDDLQNISPKFPCIIKPAVMHDFYKQTKTKVFVCKDFEELKTNYQKALNLIPAEEIIVQNIIIGPSKNQFSACFLFLEGKSYVSLTATRMRQHPIDFGNATTYAETVELPIIKEYAQKILEAANYNGLCEVEFKKDDTDGEFKFLEVNTRTWKWHSIAEKAETPFLLSYYQYLSGIEIQPIEGQKNASFRHALTDIPIQIKLFIKGYNYFLRKKYSTVKAVWAADDVKPWIFEKIYLPYLIFKR